MRSAYSCATSNTSCAADADVPLPIGCGQTISQPSTVQLMLEWLGPRAGEKILDVGSGWTTALLAHAVGSKGRVYAVEIVPELVEMERDNCARAGMRNASFFQAGDRIGLPEHATYDRILVSASAERVPNDLRRQLKVAGRLAAPASITCIIKSMAGQKALVAGAEAPARRETASRQRETTQAEREAHFQLVLKNTTDIITVFDREGRITYQSPAIGRILGRDAADRIGANIFDSTLVHPHDRASKRRFVKKLIEATPGQELKDEFRLRHADGSYRDIEAVGVNFLDDPELHGIILSSRDVTERKAAERALKAQHKLEVRAARLAEQREQLIAVNKAKDEFISIASHQLRTPASGVKQYVGMVLQGYAGPVTLRQRGLLAKAYASNERQLNIINALLNVARLDAGKVAFEPGACNLSNLLTDILDEHRLQFAQQRQKLILDKPAKPIVARTDERLLRMAIENLIDNAGKYSPAGKPILVSLRRSGRQAEIVIRDQGVGIAKKHQANLFQKFSRVENPLSVSAGGSGLGLYWAKKIIDLHGGRIELASKLRQGSTFTIKLPLAPTTKAK